MRGIYERLGQMVRVEFDFEQKRIVELLIGDVCPADYTPDQLQKASATLSMFTARNSPLVKEPRISRAKRAAAG